MVTMMKKLPVQVSICARDVRCPEHDTGSAAQRDVRVQEAVSRFNYFDMTDNVSSAVCLRVRYTMLETDMASGSDFLRLTETVRTTGFTNA